MLVKTKALVINALRYQDTSLVVKCFTKSDGLKSYIVKGVYGSKKGKMHPSYFSVLTILEIEATHRNKGGLESIKTIKPLLSYLDADMYKASQVFFMAEILSLLLIEGDINEPLFDFVENQLQWFCKQDKAPDFHLFFLVGLTRFVGFYPNVSNGDYFSLEEGLFTASESLTSLNKAHSDLFKRLLAEDVQSQRTTFTRTERLTLLDYLLKYCTTHIEGFRRSKSLEVLKEVFN